MLDKVKSLEKTQLITLQDAAIVTWPVGKIKPKTKQLVDMAGTGALQGTFLGMLFGLSELLCAVLCPGSRSCNRRHRRQAG
jgi:uncharacterized membrane protein